MNGLKELVNMLISQIGFGCTVSKFAAKGAAYITGQLLKVVPCLGFVGGGIINGSIAGAITFAYGMAISTFCYHKIELMINNGMEACITDDDVQSFIKVFQEAFKAYSAIERKKQVEH